MAEAFGVFVELAHHGVLLDPSFQEPLRHAFLVGRDVFDGVVLEVDMDGGGSGAVHDAGY